MRVELISKVAATYKTDKVTAKRNVYSTAVSDRDQLSISQTGYDYQIAKQAVAEASDIREDKVSQLKGQIASNKYSVDAGDFASKLLEQYNAMNK